MVSAPAASSASRRWPRLGWAVAGLVAAGLILTVLRMVLPHNGVTEGKLLTLSLEGGAQKMPYFCKVRKPRGIVILGTGDGGWSYWEENTAKHLESEGYAVGGWDCRKFADSRTYDYAQLCAGYLAAVELVRKRSRAAPGVPIWYGGWSTGAEQSLAAATAEDRPRGLAGLLLAAPGSRGRFGLTASDLLGQTPTGPGTFSLAEMSEKLRGVPVAEFAAGLDPLGDTAWLAGYRGPKRIFELPGLFHDMGGAGEEFLAKLDEAIAWTLEHQP